MLVKICNRNVEKFRYAILWENNRVLAYNSTIVAKGLTHKVIYTGRDYIIPIGNGTHFIVYAASIGRFPLYSKGIFHSIDAIAIYPRENVLKPSVVYMYFYAKDHPSPTRYYYNPIEDRSQMIWYIARLQNLPQFWMEDLIKEKSMTITAEVQFPDSIKKEIIRMELVKSMNIDNRLLWIVKYEFLDEDSKIYACVDAETKLIVGEVFISEGEKAVYYLAEVVRLEDVPIELLSQIRDITYIDVSKNKSIEIPRTKNP
ncbi:MAG: hypothetical protein RMI79_00410 [Nitrososphaerota archaeon]|nr:hypothetical protein [Nitrososphaerota archaeon]